MERVVTAYYLRLMARDEPGVMARIASILGEQGISIEAIHQKEPGEGDTHVPLVMLTHRVLEGRMNEAIARIEALDSVQGRVMRIRTETLAG
jgi:homoserine dehydrogenase